MAEREEALEETTPEPAAMTTDGAGFGVEAQAAMLAAARETRSRRPDVEVRRGVRM